MGTNDQPPAIRSINNDHVAPVRFVNTTMHQVQLLWINFEGQAVNYGTLSPGDTLAISTFATHPWIFVEAETMERFVVRGKDVFYPEPWFLKYDGFPRSQIPKKIPPELVYITLPMYTLRDIAMRFIKSILYDDNDAYLLDIPKNLQEELATLEPRKNAASRRNREVP